MKRVISLIAILIICISLPGIVTFAEEVAVGTSGDAMTAVPAAAGTPIVSFGLGLILIIAVIVVIIVIITYGSKMSKERFEEYRRQHPQTGQTQNGYVQLPSFAQDAPSGGFATLGFFFPLIGFILYLVWNTTLPFRARSAGKGALIGAIVYVAVSVISVVVFMNLLH